MPDPTPKTHADPTAPMALAQVPVPAARWAAGLVLLYTETYEALRPAYPLGDSEVLIGRDPDADVHIPVAAASRQHARVQRRGGRWVVSDLGGRNGTLVNGALVQEVALAHGDEIRLGDAIFKFVDREAEQYAGYRIDGAFLDTDASGEVRPRFAAGGIVGGYQIQRIVAGLREIARSELSVLLGGESGTGKEVFAQAVHDWSGRRGPFQAVNCAAIPATLIEGELFGHRRGAFSGADRDRTGLIRAAHGGTLFLDEIGDMPLEAQAKLLRVIQSREVIPLGASQPERVDARFVCATHRDLAALQQADRFRGDLFARLNDYSVMLPPLRERKEDIFSLCLALAARHGRADVRFTFPFMAGLLHYKFPYNVRELEALIKRWIAVRQSNELSVDDLTEEMQEAMRAYAAPGRGPTPHMGPLEVAPRPFALSPAPPQAALSTRLPARAHPSESDLRRWLADHRGNVAAVARQIGRDRVQVHRWMKRYGIDVEEYR